MDRGNTMPRDGRSIIMLLFSFTFHFFLFSLFSFLFFFFFYKNTSCTDLLMHVLIRSSGWVDMCLDLDTRFDSCFLLIV